MKLKTLKFFDKLLATIVNRLPTKTMRHHAPSPSRILIIKLSAMGDALCMFPAARRLATVFPEAHIDWLTTKRSNPVYFSALPFLNKTIILSTSLRDIFISGVRILLSLRRYDLIIDFDQYYRVSELLSYFGKINAGFDAPLKGSAFAIKIPYDPGINETDMFHRLIDRVLAEYSAPSTASSRFDLPELLTGFQPSERLRAIAADIRSIGLPVLAFYPGSSRNAAFRRLDAGKYLQVIESLRSRCTVVIAGGPDEAELKPVFPASSAQLFNLIGELSLLEWTWLFHSAIDVFVGNDGGLLHVAESQSVPVVGIFGPALYRKWGSANPRSIAVETSLPCRPCLKNYLGMVPSHCQFETVKCLDAITTQSIVDAVDAVLDKTAVPHP
ncbi:heptosyltransferase [Chromobacterium sp. ATCC 53434]|uniref:glycosyltransferase family 9 protein n=1 Tax=Chromobacterium sp. (strain ATCC 53434 / SC 14030) TaxID=2059672 RepID=UPI000C78F483|nr:glycosyltransferase family 9 protein [Chromobacterium sp. ATCC 53434]AUH52564.1 heptosyltransferase [Chromobacterium sp. ATCC 53434]